jgi:cytosine/uracil/thiamine/allantoin permease
MRSAFGMYGAYFAVLIHGVAACICKCVPDMLENAPEF